MKNHRSRRKRIVSLVLALVLIIGMIPMTGVTVKAATTYPVYWSNTNIFIGGHDIWIVDGTTSGRTAIYYMDGTTKNYITSGGAAGQDLSSYSIYCGTAWYADSSGDVGDVTVTMTGGSLSSINGGGHGASNCNAGNVTLIQTGGSLSWGISRLGFSSYSKASSLTVYSTSGVSVKNVDGSTHYIVKNGTTWNVKGNAKVPSGYTMTIEKGDSLSLPSGSTLTNNGTLYNYSSNLTGDGKFVNNGTVKCYAAAYGNWVDQGNGLRKGTCIFCNSHGENYEVIRTAATQVTNDNYASLGLDSSYVGYYAISNMNELYWFADLTNGKASGYGQNASANAVLLNDIHAQAGIEVLVNGALRSDLSKVETWQPIGDYNNNGKQKYSGTFDGKGHTISGLYTSKRTVYNTGIVGDGASASVVKRVTLKDSYLQSDSNNVGGIVGYSEGTVEQCATVNCVIKGASYVGGIAGINSAGTIRNCYSTSDLTATKSFLGGIAGCTQYDGCIYNCYYAGKNTCSSYNGALTTIINADTSANCVVDNCYYDSSVSCHYGVRKVNYGTATNVHSLTKAQFQSGKATWFLNGKTTKDAVWKQTIGTDDYPRFAGSVVYASAPCPRNFSNSSKTMTGAHEYDEEGICIHCWGAQPATLNGDVYEISNPAQLKDFAAKVSAGETTANAILKKDIDMTSDSTFSIGTSDNAYAGTFNGNDCQIKIKIETSEAYAGLFRYVNGATIKNLTVDGSIKTSNKFAGSIIGKADGGTVTLDRCLSSVTIESTQDGDGTHGGLVAHLNSGTLNITNCGFVGAINGENTNNCGGMVGWSNGTTKINTAFVAAQFGIKSDGGSTFARGNNITLTNCYYLNALGDVGNAKSATADQFASGELTWNFNGQSSYQPIWKQTLGEGGDPYPNFRGKTVYLIATDCGGKNGTGFSNTKTVIEHVYDEEGFCHGTAGEVHYEAPALSGTIYQITKPAHLLWFAGLVNGTLRDATRDASAKAVLLNDLDMKNATDYVPIGATTGLYYETEGTDKGYTGTFTGNGHVIRNLTVRGSDSAERAYGIFGTLSGTVSHLGVENLKFTVGKKDCRAGGIAGQMLSGGLIKDCYVADSAITATGKVAGGIVGCNYAGKIDNCLTYKVSVTASRTGGIVGDNRGDASETDRQGTVINCYTDADTIENVQRTGLVTASSTRAGSVLASGQAAWNLNGRKSSSAVWKQTIGTDAYPKFTGAIVYQSSPCATYANTEFAGDKEHDYADTGICKNCGSGLAPELKNGVYQIKNAGNLYWFSALTNGYLDGVEQDPDANAILVNDIIVNENVIVDGALATDTSAFTTWSPIGDYSSNGNHPYAGTFNGNRHSISGLYAVSGANSLGLIRKASADAQIKNLTVKDSYLTAAGNNVGAIVGYSQATLEKCVSENCVIQGTSYVGGIAGINAGGTIRYCYSTSALTATQSYLGGIAGVTQDAGSVAKCYYAGKSTCNSNNSAITAIANSEESAECSVTDCYYEDTVTCHQAVEKGSYGTVTNVEQKTKAEFRSGAVAWLLNDGTSKNAVWRQTLGTDAYPQFTGGVLYQSAPCITYANTPFNGEKAHDYRDNGICSGCGKYEEAELKDGYYEISNLGKLLWFADKVNAGDNQINAKLTAKIDGGSVARIKIGTSEKPYSGIFDGNGQTLVIGLDANEQYLAPFPCVKGATIRDLTVEGTIKTSMSFAASFIGQVAGGEVTIERCLSSVVIHSTKEGDGTHGGFVANVSAGKLTINHCGYTGAIKTSVTTDCGGFVGWTNQSARTYINHSYITATFDKTDGCNTFSRNPNYLTVTNSYYQNKLGNSPEKNVAQKSAAAFASGEVTWCLEQGGSGGVWKQTLGENSDPYPNFTGKTVYQVLRGCSTAVAGYSNEEQTKLEHSYGEDGFCRQVEGELHYQPAVWNADDSRYEISNAGQLYWFAALTNGTLQEGPGKNASANAILTCDIKINDGVIVDGALASDTSEFISWTPIGDWENNGLSMYRGTFDGNGHSISGLYASKRAAGENGIVGDGGSASVIKNLTLKDSYLHSTTKNVGGIAGKTYGTIEKCATVNCVIKGASYVGGIVGFNQGTIRNCYSTSDLTATGSYLGGIAGVTYSDGCIYNCYYAGKNTCSSYNGAITAIYNNINSAECVVDNCYYDSSISCHYGVRRVNYGTATNIRPLTKAEFQSGLATWYLNGKESTGIWKQTLGTDDYPQFTGGTVYGTGTYPQTTAVESCEHSFDEDGFCTCGAYETPANEEGVYQISNAGQFFWFAAYVNDGNPAASAVLTKDIDLKNKEWTPIGWHTDVAPASDRNAPYQGTFDGQYHVIRNLNVKMTTTCEGGLFGRTQDAILKNFGVIGATVESTKGVRCGVIGGEIYRSTVMHVFTAGEISITTDNENGQAGGLAGECANSTLTECFTTYGMLTTAAQTVTDCYYMAEEANAKSVGDYRTQTQFADGSLTYELNKGVSDGTQIWYQTLAGKHVQAYPQFTGGTVYGMNGHVIGAKDSVYDGKPQKGYTGELTDEGNTGDVYTFTYVGRNETVYETTADAPVNVGDYTVTIKRGETQEISLDFSITIRDAKITDATQRFARGEELVKTAVTADGLAAGHVLFVLSVTKGADCTYTATVAIEDADGNDATANYDVTNQGVYHEYEWNTETHEYHCINCTDVDNKDTTAPTAKYQIGTNGLKKFLNTITFGLFSKDYQTVEITAEDDNSGVALIRYAVSDEAWADTVPEDVTWTTYEEKLSLNAKQTYFIYVKVTDIAGNTAIYNSEGIVIFEDSEATAAIEYTRTTHTDQKAEISFNGNTVKEVKYEERTLTKGTDYTVQTDGITFTSAFLETLAASDTAYHVTVSYHAGGQQAGEDSYGDTPADTVISVTVKRAEGQVTDISDVSKTYDGEGVAEATYTSLSTGRASYVYKKKNAADDTYTDQVPTDAGSYTVRVTVEADGNYKEASGEKNFAITNAELADVSAVQSESLTYTGEPQSAKVSTFATAKGNQTVTFTYSKTADGVYTETVPAFTAQGGHTVYYRASAPNHNTADGTFTVTIRTATNSWITLPSITGWTYGQDANAPAADVRFGEWKVTYKGTANDGSLYASENAPTQAGSYQAVFTVEGTTDYTGLRASVPFTVAKADKEAPKGIGHTDETIDAKADGTISGVDDTMEYKADGADGYTGITGSPLTDLSDGTYRIRYKETPNYSASADATVTIKAGRKLVVTLPDEQTGYTITADQTSLSWKESVNLTFTLHEGYTATENFAVMAGDQEVVLMQTSESAVSTGIVSEVKNDLTVTVNGVADVTSPEEMTVTLGENSWKQFFHTITFGLFFKETQTVEITASDKGSGLDAVYYYLATEALSEEAVKALADTEWTKYTGAFHLNPQDEYIIYAKAADKDGNVTYVSSEQGIIIDDIKPVIGQITDGEICYGDTAFTVTDKHLDTVTVDGNTVTPDDNGIYTIVADGKKHTVAASDRSGNIADTVTVTLITIASLDDEIEDITTDNVKSSDKNAIDAVHDFVVQLIDGDKTYTQTETEQLEDMKKNTEKLQKKIADTAEEIKSITDSMNTYDEASVKSSDKDAIEALLTRINALLSSDNLTADERNAMSALKTKAEGLIQKIGDTTAEINALEAGMNPYQKASVKSSDKDAVDALLTRIKAILAGENLTADERNAMNDLKTKAESLLKKIDDTAAEIADLTDSVNAYDEASVKSSDKDAIEALLTRIKALLDGDNLTATERQAVQTLKTTATGLIQKINDTAAEYNDITDGMNAYDEASVKSSDKDAIEALLTRIKALLAGENLTTEERNAMNDLKTKAESLLKKIDDTAAEMNALTDGVNAYDEASVKSSDKDAISGLLTRIKALLDGENLTTDERNAMSDLKAKAESLLKKINDTTAEIKDITDSMDTYDEASVKSSDKDAIEALIPRIKALLDGENLTADERNAMTDLQAKAEGLLQKIADTATEMKNLTEGVNAYDEVSVKSDDREAIDGLLIRIHALLDGDNLTEDERNAMNDLKAKAESLIQKIDDTMAEKKDITDRVNAYDIDQVTSDDKQAITDLIARIDTLLEGDNLNDTEREELGVVKDTANGLLDRLSETAASTDTDDINKVKDITAENVQTEDKDDLEKAQKDLEKALEDYAGNLTEDEKKNIQSEIDRIGEALTVIGNVENVEEMIDSLPDKITKDDANAIQAAAKAYDALTEYEQSILDKDLKKKLEHALSEIDRLNKADTASPLTGGPGGIWLWFALLFACGGLFGAAYRKKRR